MDGQTVYVKIIHYVDRHYVRCHCEEEGMISAQWVFGSEVISDLISYVGKEGDSEDSGRTAVRTPSSFRFFPPLLVTFQAFQNNIRVVMITKATGRMPTNNQ